MAIRMFNVSLEDIEIQCDSKVFTFHKRSSTEVDEHLVPYIYTQLKDRGVFPIYLSMSKDDIKKASRTAMLAYLGGTLQLRIRNYMAQKDDFHKRGVTLSNDVRLDRAIRWEKEIVALLEIEAPIHEELSFLDSIRRESIGITDERIKAFAGEDLFDSDDLLIENGLATPEVMKRKAGRPRKIDSFADTDLEKEIEGA